MKKINVDIRKLVELTERGLSYRGVTAYLNDKGIKISYSTVYSRLTDYYESQEKPEKRKNARRVDMDIEELVELKEQGKTDKEITEYLNEQGIQISISVVNQRLTEYYYIMGKEKPKKTRSINKIDLDIKELVELKEQGKTEKEITEYLNEQGIQISIGTVNKRLTKYYESQGREKPKKHIKGIKRVKENKSVNKIHIDIKEIVDLKEQGMSDIEITKKLQKQGIKISYSVVNMRLNKYYNLQGIAKPKKRRDVNKIDIDIEELVKLTEQGMLDYEIVNYLAEQGKKVSVSIVSKKLKEYYKAQGRTNKRVGAHKKNINIEKLVALKKQGMSNTEIAKYLNERGIEISRTTVSNRLIEYNLQGIDKTIRLYDNDIEEVLMRGMTVEEFVNQYTQQDNEGEIREKFRKLRVVAEYSKKENGEVIQDNNFISVLNVVEYPEQNTSRLEKVIETYTENGVLKKGKIQEIKDMIFQKNTNLMVYMLTRLDISLHDGYDQRIFESLKTQYKEKIDKYLRRIEQTDNNRRQIQKTNSAPNSSGDGR